MTKIADNFVVPMDYTHFGYEFLQNMGDGLHLGVDLNWGKPWDDEGKQINATGSGKIVYSKKSTSSRGWGNLIIIEHELPDNSKIYSRYAHLKDRWIAEGQNIECNQGIGTCGHTGTECPHLHFDMFVEKFLKDGNKLTDYPQKWNEQKLRSYFFDPLLFIKNFGQPDIDTDELQNKIQVLFGQVSSYKTGIEKLAFILSCEEKTVEPTIQAIEGEISGLMEKEDKLEDYKSKLTTCNSNYANFVTSLAKVFGTDDVENEVLKTAKKLKKYKDNTIDQTEKWKREKEKYNEMLKEKVKDWKTWSLLRILIRKVFNGRK